MTINHKRTRMVMEKVDRIKNDELETQRISAQDVDL